MIKKSLFFLFILFALISCAEETPEQEIERRVKKIMELNRDRDPSPCEEDIRALQKRIFTLQMELAELRYGYPH